VTISNSKQATLYGSVRDEIDRRLTEADWTAAVDSDPDPDSWVLGDFRRPLTDDFSATAFFMRQTFSGREEHLDVSGCIGISYIPAYRLWRLLGALNDSDVAFDIGTLQDPPVDTMTLTVREPEEVNGAVDVLVSPILERGARRLREYSNVDAILNDYRENPNFDLDMRAVPIVLAAAGRYDQALTALADFTGTDREEVKIPEYRQFAERLTRWIDSSRSGG
jgi:hypothetical protein